MGDTAAGSSMVFLNRFEVTATGAPRWLKGGAVEGPPSALCRQVGLQVSRPIDTVGHDSGSASWVPPGNGERAVTRLLAGVNASAPAWEDGQVGSGTPLARKWRYEQAREAG